MDIMRIGLADLEYGIALGGISGQGRREEFIPDALIAGICSMRRVSMTLEILHSALMIFRSLETVESAKISPLSRLWILFT